MTCDLVRVALSARLDGEEPHVTMMTLDVHVARCLGCREWLARAQRIDQAMRRRVEVPDMTAALLAAVSVGDASVAQPA